MERTWECGFFVLSLVFDPNIFTTSEFPQENRYVFIAACGEMPKN